MIVIVEFYDEEVFNVLLLQKVICVVIEIELVVKGQIVVNSYKFVIFDNGVCIIVLLFVVIDEVIIVNMEIMEYVECV